MANYECAIRTNYFHVKDKEAFLEFTKKVLGRDGATTISFKDST